MWWWATEAGEHEVKIKIDPNGLQNEADTSDNEYSFTFNISERPVEPTLRFLTSAVTITPNSIPSPSVDLDKPIPYQIKVRIDNLNEFSREIPETVKNEVNKNKDIINIITDKKYLSISIF